MHLVTVFCLIFAAITVNNSENNFFASRNSTKDLHNNGSKSGDHIDFVKSEIKKYISECKTGDSEEESSESSYLHSQKNLTTSEDKYNQKWDQNYGGWNSMNSNNSYGYRNSDSNTGYGNSNPSFGYSNSEYGNSNSNGGYGSLDNGYGSSYGRSNLNNGQGNSGVSYGNWASRGNNMGYNNSGYGSYNGNFGYGRGSQDYGRASDAYGNSDSTHSRRSDYNSGSYGTGQDSFSFGRFGRSKRSSDDDAECLSQCVFGYLEVLDDNRSPSELAMIKWFQDHMPHDGKRIKALRHTRRCFGQLSVSDNEDGCEFSKSLSKCLNLDIEI